VICVIFYPSEGMGSQMVHCYDYATGGRVQFGLQENGR
jgi:hypothetical protein